ncbi:helix-turn-helix domain-containing protein [Allostreptomyces psammosilenae]|uniref:DNA-binding protein n=1 Tax=Allostreptomyces psammosilenae TaxID=1892865 RepID=A0A853A3W2_9ACTN|nr:DNA-binding protein [Allostreptomyces psammosilenae]NYI05391.1 hypothetical protein [Allostreptomyces psammosilenae]
MQTTREDQPPPSPGGGGAPSRDATERARQLQRAWYGEPLGDLFRRLLADLDLNQSRLAGVLGLSAPMLSQLMHGRRTKIGNPVAVRRLDALRELDARLRAGEIDAAGAAARVAEIQAGGNASGGGFGVGNPQHGGAHAADATSGGATAAAAGEAAARPGPPTAVPVVVREIQSLLHTICPPEEISRAAGELADDNPDLAEFLRIYGTGSAEEAVRHYRAHLPRPPS